MKLFHLLGHKRLKYAFGNSLVNKIELLLFSSAAIFAEKRWRDLRVPVGIRFGLSTYTEASLLMLMILSCTKNVSVLPNLGDQTVLQHDLLLRFKPRYFCSAFNTSIYLICILSLCCSCFIISLGRNSAKLSERRAVLPFADHLFCSNVLI